MSEIRVVYKRMFQLKPYETETVELSVTDLFHDIDAGGRQVSTVDVGRLHVDIVAQARELYGALAAVGDQLVVERMASAPQASPDPRPGVVPPGKEIW